MEHSVQTHGATSPAHTLDDILSNGIHIDLHRAEQCFALRTIIAEHAEGINGASFGDLFGNLQQILYQFAVLSVAKVFERPGSQYPLRSIPAALAHMNEYAADLAIWNPHDVIKGLVTFGHIEGELNRLSHAELTRTLCAEYNHRLPQADKSATDEPSKTLYAIKTARDKFISHNEAINLDNFPEVNFEEVTNLIQFALEFLRTIGRGYLTITYSGTVGEFLKTTDAAAASRGLERLLKTLGISGEIGTG
jgi:hypothetical protein